MNRTANYFCFSLAFVVIVVGLYTKMLLPHSRPGEEGGQSAGSGHGPAAPGVPSLHFATLARLLLLMLVLDSSPLFPGAQVVECGSAALRSWSRDRA